MTTTTDHEGTMTTSKHTPDTPAAAEPGPKARMVMHRVNSLYEKAHVNWRASREWRRIANEKNSPNERAYNARLAEVTEQIAKCYEDCAASLVEVTLQLDDPPPPPPQLVTHVAIAVDIDRFSDDELDNRWLPTFALNKLAGNVAELRALCATARADGLEVFPPCDKTDAKGYCQHGKATPDT